MPDPESLTDRALRHGVQPTYEDVWGTAHEVPRATLEALLEALDDTGLHDTDAMPPVRVVEAGSTRGCPELSNDPAWTLSLEDGTTRTGPSSAALPVGYHQLQVEGRPGTTLLIAAPIRACTELRDGRPRTWGPAVQLYALRSERNWGIGDFADLEALIDEWAAFGAGIVGLNPLHALFTQLPEQASPYSPSSRLWLNPLYIAVDAVADLTECKPVADQIASAPFQARLQALRNTLLVDYTGVAAIKLQVLESLHRHFMQRHANGDTPHGREFRQFQRDGGPALRAHATFEALSGRFHGGWRDWPAAFHDPASADVRHFAEEHAAQVEFHEYLQWLAASQLARVQARCVERGMAVGLYLDLAVSIDPNGSDAWNHASVYAGSMSIGAPPDEFNPKGQGWGLAPLRPDRLRATQHRLFIDVMSRAMANAGAVRIDHVMGLMRLFWVPPGRDASEGAYVHYPFDELLAIVKLESARHGTIVIGEDLGTVDEGVRDALARGGVLSYRLLYFERRPDGGFKSHDEYPPQALAAISTHDLATFAGWWRAHDLAERQALDLFPEASIHRDQCEQRVADRARLLALLCASGDLSGPDAAVLEPLGRALPPELVRAVHAFLGRTPATIAMVQLEDVAGVVEQSNMPGTVDEHPNWRRKLPAGAPLTQRPGAEAVLRALGSSRSS